MSTCVARLLSVFLLVFGGVAGANEALVHAVLAEDVGEVRALLEADQCDLEWRAESGWTPLIHAVLSGRTDVVEVLLEAGADVNGLSRNGSSPLCFAAMHSGVEMVQLLLDRGAKTDAQRDGRASPMKGAIFSGDVEVVDLLTEHGGDPSDTTEWRKGDSPVLRAAQYGHAELYKRLVASGMALEWFDDLGRTPTHLAAENGFAEIVGATIGAKVAIDRAAFWNNRYRYTTPLAAAAYYGHDQVVDRLIKAGAAERRIDRQEALDRAELRGHLGAYALLLEADGSSLAGVKAEQGGDELTASRPGVCEFGYLDLRRAQSKREGGVVDAALRAEVSSYQPVGSGGKLRVGIVAGVGSGGRVAVALQEELGKRSVLQIQTAEVLRARAQERGFETGFAAQQGGLRAFGEALGVDALVFCDEIGVPGQSGGSRNDETALVELRLVDVATGLVVDTDYVSEDEQAIERAVEALGGRLERNVTLMESVADRRYAVALEWSGAPTSADEVLIQAGIGRWLGMQPGVFVTTKEQMEGIVLDEAIAGDEGEGFWKEKYEIRGKIAESAWGGFEVALTVEKVVPDAFPDEISVSGDQPYKLVGECGVELGKLSLFSDVVNVEKLRGEEAAYSGALAARLIESEHVTEAKTPADFAALMGRRELEVVVAQVAGRLSGAVDAMKGGADAGKSGLREPALSPAERKEIFMEVEEALEIALGFLAEQPGEAVRVLSWRGRGVSVREPLRKAIGGVYLFVGLDSENQVRFTEELGRIRNLMFECLGHLLSLEGDSAADLAIADDWVPLLAVADYAGPRFRGAVAEIERQGGEGRHASFPFWLAKGIWDAFRNATEGLDEDLQRRVAVDVLRSGARGAGWAELADDLVGASEAHLRIVGAAVKFQLEKRHRAKLVESERLANELWMARGLASEELARGRRAASDFRYRLAMEAFDEEWSWLFLRQRPFHAHYREVPMIENLRESIVPSLVDREHANWEITRRLPAYLTAYLVGRTRWVEVEFPDIESIPPPAQERYRELIKSNPELSAASAKSFQ